LDSYLQTLMSLLFVSINMPPICLVVDEVIKDNLLIERNICASTIYKKWA
jgi:hypothetical protein